MPDELTTAPDPYGTPRTGPARTAKDGAPPRGPHPPPGAGGDPHGARPLRPGPPAPVAQPGSPPRRITSAYQWALAFGIRRCEA
ncbi:hypothetical protein GA0115252_126423 [Streptomyces sp. DfronAA-171]|nr:hypothetical protein GA0115252_126423 [Streptomyces sp. DfronAA-171]